jgi:2-oxoglutarate dehydrogenase E2 component (dihydrolipoamide succinyltransferase)
MSEAVAVVVPQMNPNDDHVVIVCWHVTSGSRVAADQVLATVETTKAAFDIHAPAAGYAFFEHEPKSVVAVGDAIAWISDEQKAPQTTRFSRPAAAEIAGGEPRFSRKALRRMKELGLSASDFGAEDRVEVADVERAARERDTRPSQRLMPTDADPLEQSAAKVLEAARLSAVYRDAIPSLVCVAISSEKLNRRLQIASAQAGPLSPLELVIHDAARMLSKYPDLNGFHAEGQAWTYRTIAVGFAINLGRSLRVPVVRNAAELSYIDIARAVRELSLKYMRNELTTDDVTGGTFTLTDLSQFGVVHFVPVLNERQSAILGICAERPGSGYRELVLTFDHRMADGMRAASFLSELVSSIETAPGD